MEDFSEAALLFVGRALVEADTESSFIAKFKFRYGCELVGGDTVNFYYGKFPT